MVGERPTRTSRWSLERLALASIFVFVVLTVGVVDQLHGKPPTPSDTPRDMAHYFTQYGDRLLVAYLIFNISAFFLFVYVGALWKAFRGFEGEPGWLSALVLGGGLIAIGTAVIDNAVFASAGRAGTSYVISPEFALWYFHFGFVFFAGWIGFAMLLFAAGLIILRTGIFARWLGWWALGLIALWMLASWPAPRNASTLQTIVFDYTGPVSAYLTYIWMIWIAVVLMKREARAEARAAPAAPSG
jgi:hypothetical protein